MKSNVQFREIQKQDDAAICTIIKKALEEYHDNLPGTAYYDPELAHLSQFYLASPKRTYLVVTSNGTVIGGCGIGETSVQGVAEVQKLYLSAETRGKGIGKKLLQLCEERAKNLGYHKLYIETLSNMTSALGLYHHVGFKQLEKPLINSQHTTCDIWLSKTI
ncbi:GNAT family N-acetyltransferase [Lactobacillus sp. ESL0684]|uniref:GNAT family N-acetyltransferase n=1 Tax=Lactobacillus sp. ESL0684 TaxID=2983213 RepID=UPI0023F732CD|nr:GNAT family N-acetyltransferase [Lactobacillus sp. ESL0684]WEV43341.1 GNAT family N-acetyltransferase [Lactobacillus sp. ESL0684]